jgi:hypothetical protein
MIEKWQYRLLRAGAMAIIDDLQEANNMWHSASNYVDPRIYEEEYEYQANVKRRLITVVHPSPPNTHALLCTYLE